MMIPITRPELPPLEDYAELLAEIWSTRMLSNFAAFANKLEALISNYLGVGVRVVVNGDVGLTLAVAALQIPEGSSCIVPSFTFSSTVNAILWNRLRPVFVDIEPGTLNVDVPMASRVARESDARLIIATHVFGNPANTDELASLASGTDAHLLYDAAHAYGSMRGGAKVGNFGDLEVFSLSGTKVVTSAEGGVVASRHEGLLERITLLRGYGFFEDYNTQMAGMNAKMSELHAALGLLTLERVEQAVATRQRHVHRYKRLLSVVPGLKFQTVRDGDRSTYKDFAVLFASGHVRHEVQAALTREGVQTKRYFLPCHQMDAFRDGRTTDLHVTDTTYDCILCLPLYESLSAEQIDRICEVVMETTRCLIAS